MKVDLKEIEEWSKYFSEWRQGTLKPLFEAVRVAKIFCDHKMLTTGNSIGKQGTLSPELMQLGMALSKIDFGDDRNES